MFEPLKDVQGLWWKAMLTCFIIQFTCSLNLAFWKTEDDGNPLKIISVASMKVVSVGVWGTTLAVIVWDTFFR